MICFARSTSVDAGQLHENLIVGGVSRDDGLGDAELVDAALDRMTRLLDGGLRVQLQRLVGLDAQNEVHAAVQVQTELDGCPLVDK